MTAKRPPIRSALTTAQRLWPEFEVVDDLVFFSWCAPKTGRDVAGCDRTGMEHNANHTHVVDCFSHKANLPDEPWWDQTHVDFKAACEFGKKWAEMVAAKLGLDFPGRAFFVYYTEQDNPIIRFHQEHPGEPPLISVERYADEIARGEVIVHYVARRGSSDVRASVSQRST